MAAHEKSPPILEETGMRLTVPGASAGSLQPSPVRAWKLSDFNPVTLER